jgi:hypothetical protein
VVRELGAKLVDEPARHHPGGRRADHADDDVHLIPAGQEGRMAGRQEFKDGRAEG